MSKQIFIDRPPRIQPELPFEEIEIPNPPNKQESSHARLIQIALPLMTIIGYVLVSALGGIRRNPWLLLPMAMSVLASVGFSIYSHFKEKRRLAEIEQAYSDQLVEMNKEMHNYHDMQRRFSWYNYPDYAATVRIVQKAREESEKTRRTLRSESRLWERRVSDEDFGVVRLGVGTLPSTVIYKLGNVDNFDDPQVREALKLQTDSRFVSDMPVTITLRHPPEEEQSSDEEKDENQKIPQTPVTHALGIAGERNAVYQLTRSLLTHFVVFHAPMNARLYILANDQREWAWTESLPHSQDDDQSTARCFVSAMKKEQHKQTFGGDDENELDHFLEGIRKVLSQRKIRLQENNQGEGQSQGDPTLPLLLVVVDLLDTISDKKSPLSNLESDAAISILLEEGAMLGAAVIFLVPERSKVPGGCRSVIEVEETTPATNSKIAQNQKIHFRYAETGVNTFRYVGGADIVPTLEEMTTLAEVLAMLDIRQSAGANLNNAVPFLQLMGYRTLEDLQQHAWHNWQQSIQPEHASWLWVKIGLMAGNKPRSLVFSARRDGVHGMVAGSTGSGKSELLISLIAGMAVTFDPTVLNFVLVDYKGGGAFNDFKKLPHCVDIITNLGKDGVTRMFTAIRAEMERRQALLSATGAKNIVDYRRQGSHQHRPLPYLFIIVDEFAEMIAEQAEFRSQLESITRIGRSLGVSLILAAQRPSGVTDQMRSNIKFRISLRVETPGESREMLRRADAAFLPAGIPGRGYLQVGNEEIELIQVAYTGDKYTDPDQLPKAPVLWPDRRGSQAVDQDQEPPELYKAIIEALDNIARNNGVERQQAPWPNFLPLRLALNELLISEDPNAETITASEYLSTTDIDKIMFGSTDQDEITLNPAINQWLNGEYGWVAPLNWKAYAMRPVVGLIDNPYAALQSPLIVDFQRGHAVVFGASGWGKSTFIRTLVLSLAATHSLNVFHAYVLDLGGRNLRLLEKLPHIGAMIIPDEEGYGERVEQLIRELDTLIQQRKTILNNANVQTMYEYNQSHPNTPQPAILVAIDNFAEFIETFGTDNDSDESVLDKLVEVVRQSRPYGIHFIVSIHRLDDMSNHLYSLFTERFTLKLTDPSEYRAIVGSSVPDIGDIPGRGYTKLGRQALTFQVAVPRAGALETATETEQLEQFADLIARYVQQTGAEQYTWPVRVDALPKSVLFKQMLAREHNLALDATFLDGLKTITGQKWAESRDPTRSEWLNVTMGVISGNRPRTLSLEAKKDGVHGMIAGGTGAGKSELLMTLIVALALNYDPSILNFVLVDYKGGGAFQPFATLPHCVDVITNLNKAQVQRMFTAIGAEMQRRQVLNAETGTKDIVEYRARGLHQKHKPYPHLFIIIDEYAEMITDAPEFRDELDSITRVGRSVGVNLLLASQRPIGVTDQMRANIKYRICLRVEGVDTSREMLRRSDAAFLPSGMPGRGYLQVGNENIELMQVAYTGDSYAYDTTAEQGEKPKFYEVMVRLANELLQGDRPRTPWPPSLPPRLTTSYPLIPEYLNPNYQALITLGQPVPLQLNPFVEHWLHGRGNWYGVDWNQTAMRAIVGLLDDPHQAYQMPLVVDLSRGHAVLFGASGWGKTTFMRSLIMNLASTHSPNECQMHILDLGGRTMEVLRTLPHVGTIIIPDERGYEERVQQLWRELNDLIDERKQQFNQAGVSSLIEYNDSKPDSIEPSILVVIDNFNEFIESFGNITRDNAEDNLLEMFVSLARQGRAYGLHFAISVNRLNELSSKLYSLFTERFALRLSDPSEYSAIVGSPISTIEEIVGRGCTRVGRMPLYFQTALPPGSIDDQGQVRGEARQIRAIGEAMRLFIREQYEQHQIRYREPLCIDALPKTSSYRQVLSEVFQLPYDETGFLDNLREAVRQQWQTNASSEHANWLRVPLGITSGNRIRTLELEAKQDGVHGLIAGGTGSGKSELLMTLIVGLAFHYPPTILNFVLVDYKGGGAFRPFAQLPHCVDIVTNLNKAAVHRMFTAINAEIRRRQALNAETGTKDIVEYRKKGLHRTREPYPHLFIIIDEYAEMIDDNPEYRLELESITRVGRAQGINLLLASQRPKGVSDQMRANIKLRLCLRVEQIDTSRELLRRPDAALLPSGMPGRGYLQVGNENLELIQVSYTGESQPDTREAVAIWPDRPQETVSAQEGEVPKLYDAAVTLTSELVRGRMANKPWPGFLPEKFSLQSPLLDAQHNATFMLQDTVTDWINGDTDTLWPGVNWAAADPVQPIVGLLDDPAEARQSPLQFLLSQSHLVVLGDSGLGKTTLLRTLIVSLAATLTPDEFHAYVLDLGGRNFRSLEALPHMGTVIYEDEESFEERIQRLFEKITGMLEERQHILSNADATSFSDYNEHHPDHQLPFVVVFIDNIAELQENYETLIETTLIPLVRRSLSVGISFVVSGNTPNNMPGKLYSLFGERVTFQQTNSDRYMDIVGRVDVEIDDIPGRGYIRREGRVLLFHAALPVGLFDENGRDTLREADQISQMAHHMQTYLPDGKSWRTTPDPIETLPEMVALSDVLDAVDPRSSRSMRAVLGENNNLQPALFDLKRMGPHFTIVGPPLSGKTTTLYNWVLSLAYHYPPSQVVFVLIDMQGRFLRYGGQHTLDQLPHVVDAISEIEQVETLIQHLREECLALSNQQRHRAIFVFIDNFEDFSDEIASNRTLLPDLAFLARRYGRDGLHFIISGTLDGVANDLRRRIQSANYGIGLRTAQAVEALRVMKTPTGLRNKELPVGRGYVVKSGQPTMIQVASPYADYGNGATIDDQQEEEEHQAQALDHWIATIRGRYSGEQATWLSSPAQSAVAAADSPRQSKLVQRSIRLLQMGMRKEIERLKAGDGAQDGADRLITEKVVQMEDWNNLDEIRLSHLIRDLWMNEKIASGFPEDTAKVIADSMEHEAFMQELEASLIGDDTA